MFQNILVYLSIFLMMKRHPSGIHYLVKAVENGGDLVDLSPDETIILEYILTHLQ